MEPFSPEILKYCLGSGVLGQWPFVDISPAEYEAIKKAKHDLYVLLGIEEKFFMVIENYLEYEGDMLNLALRHMASHNVTWSSANDAISLINRRLANLLSLARMYIDQVKHDLSGIYGKSETTTTISEAFSQQYDQLLGYRVMEQIRNYLQHQALPISSLNYPSGWEDRKTGQLLHHRFTVQMDLKRLQDNGGLTHKILQELKKSGSDAQDITPFVRQYIEGLSHVHAKLRALTHADIEPRAKILLDALQRYCEACGEPFTMIVAYQHDEENTREEVQIFGDGIDRLKQLRINMPATKLSKWFVSNEPLT